MSLFNEMWFNHVTDHMRDSFMDAVQNERLRSMPNSFLPASAVERPGVLLLGDAFNMRHPLTGGGMSVALNDVLIWRQLFQGIENLGKIGLGLIVCMCFIKSTLLVR